jgi:hypothetical protein
MRSFITLPHLHITIPLKNLIINADSTKKSISGQEKIFKKAKNSHKCPFFNIGKQGCFGIGRILKLGKARAFWGGFWDFGQKDSFSAPRPGRYNKKLEPED